MPISAHPFDMYSWYINAVGIIRNGPTSMQLFPPFNRYMMIPVAYSYNWFAGFFSSGTIPMASLPSALNFYPSANIQYVPGMLFNSVMKTPFLISDVAIAFLLYKIVEELTHNKGLAEKAAFLWFLNPFVIWISSAWGMWDTLPALFSLVAFYFLLRKKYALAAVFLSLGVASKLYPALFLVPIAVYIFRLSPVGDRWKNCLKFFSVFTGATVLLFIPYFGMIESFFTDYFLVHPTVSGVAPNHLTIAVAYGLSYWSVYSLHLLLNLPVSAEVISYVSIVSILLVALALVLVYWRTVKMHFQRPAYDLALALLLPVFALYLSYRIICEQFFIWAIPFMVILCVGGRIKGAFYWAASLVALLYVFLNCPLPFFFLPLAPWYTNALLGMIHAVWAVGTLRFVALAVLGCVFSILLVFMLFQLFTTRASQKIAGKTFSQEPNNKTQLH